MIRLFIATKVVAIRLRYGGFCTKKSVVLNAYSHLQAVGNLGR